MYSFSRIYWLDWQKKKPYPFDRTAEATDPYPLKGNLEKIDYGILSVGMAFLLLQMLSRFKRRKRKEKLRIKTFYTVIRDSISLIFFSLLLMF